MSADDSGAVGKPDLKGWIEQILPFELPSIPLVRTAVNVDKAISRLIAAGGRNLEARIDSDTARVGARSSAENQFIDAGAKIAVERSYSDGALAGRAMEHALGEAVEKQKNRESIAGLAIEDLRKTPPHADADKEIDADWLNTFADLSGSKSRADVQALWGRILSGEIRKPGSFGLRTLELLARYDQYDAEKITDLLRYVFNGEFLYCWEDGGEIPYELLSTGEETGVVRGTSFPMQKSKGLKSGQNSAFDAQDRWISISTDQDLTVEYFAYALSRPGRELATLIGRQIMPEPYLMAFANSLKAGGFKVQVSKRGPDVGDGKFTLLDPIIL